MSKITKFIISLIMVIIAMSYITVSNAATEEELISYLSQTFNVNGGTFRIPDNYLKEAKRYVATYDVSPETADKIIAKVAGYVSKMQASGVSSTSELSKEQKQELLGTAQEVVSMANASVTYKNDEVTIKGEDGKTFGTYSTDEKKTNKFVQTGYDYSVYYAIAGIAIIAIASIVILKRKIKSEE